MVKKCFSLIIVSAFALSLVSAGGIARKKDAVQARLGELFDICRSGEFEKAAGYFVYRGPDKTRKWKDVYNYSDEMEMMAVDRACKRINGYLEAYENFEFGEFEMEKESEGTWLVQTVIFKKDGESKKVYFAFLDIKGKLAIGDIDG